VQIIPGTSWQHIWDTQNYFYQLLNVHGVNNVRQTEMQTAEPFVPESSSFKVEIVTEMLRRYKSPGTD
jgi:hypothetical protein